jgi:hypothetical protein
MQGFEFPADGSCRPEAAAAAAAAGSVAASAVAIRLQPGPIGATLNQTVPGLDMQRQPQWWPGACACAGVCCLNEPVFSTELDFRTAAKQSCSVEQKATVQPGLRDRAG